MQDLSRPLACRSLGLSAPFTALLAPLHCLSREGRLLKALWLLLLPLGSSARQCLGSRSSVRACSSRPDLSFSRGPCDLARGDLDRGGLDLGGDLDLSNLDACDLSRCRLDLSEGLSACLCRAESCVLARRGGEGGARRWEPAYSPCLCFLLNARWPHPLLASSQPALACHDLAYWALTAWVALAPQ